MNDALSRAAAFARSEGLFTPGDLVVAAYSGGPDSTFLLRFLLAAKDLGLGDLDVVAVHLNHHVHSRAAECEQHVRWQAGQWEVDLVVEQADVPALARRWKCGMEAAGRRARLSVLNRVMHERGAACVATGHHLDDHAETVLTRLVRGCGPEGLGGLRPQRVFRNPPGLRVTRPLLALRRGEIRRAVAGLPVFADPTNHDQRRLRHYLRNVLMPDIESRFNPRFADGLWRMSSLAREWIGPEPDMEALVIAERPGPPRELVVHAGRLGDLPAGEFARVVARLLSPMIDTSRRLEHVHIEMLRRLRAGSPGKRVELPGGVSAHRDRGAVVFMESGKPAKDAPCINVPVRVTRMALDEVDEADLKNAGGLVAVLDAAVCAGEIRVRPAREGERFQPLGMRGTKTIRKFLAEAGVPSRGRPGYPVLVVEDRVAWVIGHRIDARFRRTAATDSVLRMETAKMPTGSGQNMQYEVVFDE